MLPTDSSALGVAAHRFWGAGHGVSMKYYYILYCAAGASIPWGNEAEIFIIAITGGKKFFFAHDISAQFLSLPRWRRNV